MGRKSRQKRHDAPASPETPAEVDGQRGEPPLPFSPAAASALLAAAFLLPNVLALGFGFVYDDFPIIVENARLHSLSRLGEVFTHGYWPDRPGLTAYRPVVQGLWALLWAAGSGSPFPFHLAGLATGLAATLLAHRVLLALRVPARPAFAAALLFALLPIHVEATASVVGMAETLAAALGLGALLAYARGQGRRALAFALWIPAVFTKESAAALPALLPFLWRIEGSPLPTRRRIAIEGSAVACVVGAALLARRLVSEGPVFIPPIDNPMSLVGPVQRVLSALWVQLLYLLRCLVPLHLAADASYREVPLVMGPDDPRAWGGIALLAAAAWLFRCRPGARLPIALWVVPFLATSNLLFPVGTMMGERLAYLPSLGLCLGVALAAKQAAGTAGGVAARRAGKEAAPTPTSRLAAAPAVLLALAALVAVLLGARSAARSLAWKDADSFYPAMAEESPGSARAWYSLGVWHASRESDAEALAAFDRAVGIFLPYPEAWNNRGNALVALGRLDEAKESYRQAVRFDPGHSGAAASLSALELGIPFRPQRRKL